MLNVSGDGDEFTKQKKSRGAYDLKAGLHFKKRDVTPPKKTCK